MWLRILIVLTEGNSEKPLEDSCVCLFVCNVSLKKKKAVVDPECLWALRCGNRTTFRLQPGHGPGVPRGAGLQNSLG